MADVVGVHGIHWHALSRDEMYTIWSRALIAGLNNVRFARLNAFKFEPAFYGHLYNTAPGVARKGGPELSDATEFELALLAEMVGEDERDAPPVKSGYAPRSVQALIRRLSGMRYFEGLTEMTIRMRLGQVRRYFTDAGLRAQAHEETCTAIGDGSPVVVGHSLGSVVAYEVLRENPAIRVDTLITLGSPLGLHAISSRLGLHSEPERNWPGSVRRWVNIAASQDVVAAVKEIAPVYGAKVEDVLVLNTRLTAHDTAPYLSNVHTSRAISRALT